jgi:hypothetical protein
MRLSPALRVRLQDAIHGRGALREGGPDLMPMHRFGDRHAAVPGQIADVLEPEVMRLAGTAGRTARHLRRAEQWVAATLQATLARFKAVRPPAGDTPE